MAGDEKIISLEERRRRRQGGAAETEPTSSEPEQLETTAASTEEAPTEPLPGKLTWLHCPTCGTLEYTEEYVPGGRIHNKCGTRVEEVVLDVDVRAEQTIAEFNLARLNMLSTWIEEQRRNFEVLQERLRKLAGGPPRAYALTEENLRRLPVAEVDALGLLVSNAFHQPSRHFAHTADAAAESDEDETPDTDEPTTSTGQDDPERS